MCVCVWVWGGLISILPAGNGFLVKPPGFGSVFSSLNANLGPMRAPIDYN